MGGSEIEQFLTHLATTKKVAASTQNQTLSALLFLYREVLDLPLDLTFQSVQARRPKHLPTVLSKSEVERVLRQMSGETLLMAAIAIHKMGLDSAWRKAKNWVIPSAIPPPTSTSGI
jgi:site-specific recombinase XerD